MLVVRWIPLIGFIAPMGLSLMPSTAMGRDLDGRYANSPLKPWFDQLKSRNGLCCSYADGYVAEDADWEAKNDHYRVRVPRGPDSKVMVWIGVPDDSVITEPNKAGRTMVWPTYVASEPDDGGDADDMDPLLYAREHDLDHKPFAASSLIAAIEATAG